MEYFQKYSKKLHGEEDRFINRVSDGISKVFFNSHFNEKEKFLQGLEYSYNYSLKGVSGIKEPEEKLGDFHKREQIQYTIENYIPELLQDLSTVIQTKEFKRATRLLKVYERMNKIEVRKDKTFEALV